MSRSPQPAALDRLDDPAPHARLLSNGRYTAILTGAGSGFSARGDCALTGWSGDRTEDGEGFFVYLRDLDDGRVWSAGHQPSGVRAAVYAARSTPGRVTIRRRDAGIETRLEACVDAARDVEIRRVTLVNRSRRGRAIEVTTYAEVVLQPLAAHRAHPAFSKLFVETAWVAEQQALVATRRPRSRSDPTPWLALAIGGGAHEHETDRARFVGRGRSLRLPAALASCAPLSGTTGSVLDPVLALRRVVPLEPGQRVSLDLALAVDDQREAAITAAHAATAPDEVARAFERAAVRERALHRRLQLGAARAEHLQDLAAAMLYGDPRLRAGSEVLGRCADRGMDLGALGFRPHALHVVAHADGSRSSFLRELATARAYWQASGLAVDLLVVTRDADATRRLLGGPAAAGAAPGTLVVRRPQEIGAADLDRLYAAADLVAEGALPLPAEPAVPSIPAPRPGRAGIPPSAAKSSSSGGSSLRIDNGYGGFAADGREYVIRVGGPDAARPPMPWINVVANEDFGFLASESGAGYTWHGNSRENRLTPWSNDPIVDPHGEAFYVRDEDDGAFWSPLPGPVGGEARYEARHGFGYTIWTHARGDLEHEVCAFVPRHDPVKVTVVTLRNRGARPRRLSIFCLQRLVLGALPAPTVTTEIDSARSAILARNPFRAELPGAVAFSAAIPPGAERVRLGTDRTAFVGRNRSLDAPAAVAERSEFTGGAGGGLDACAALEIELELPPGAAASTAFLLGEAADAAAARSLIDRYRPRAAREAALAEVRRFWSEVVSAIEVRTPSAAIDLMANGWLLYQLLACRLWARSAFYQSSGAFGFRDQIQDVTALVYARPDLTRAQILLHATHQFPEGDVLHWWHPPSGRGTRTRCSDDLLWLPYVTAFYVRSTGDRALLDERAGFVTARRLEPGEDEAYLAAPPAAESASVYEHCCRALDRSLTRGAHGLPLIGTCDWNDGMNRVGREGRGESVWLAFFLDATIGDFLPLCDDRGDAKRAERYRRYREDLRPAIAAAWDGAWYRRAYYDDGTPLGSAENDECRIDALAQAWAVISGAAPAERARQAMEAAERELVREPEGLIRLLAPPFDRTAHDPGYIKGYVPGVRENGGQYTHAALWVVRAFADLGRNDRAARLLEMLTPVAHAADRARADVYQVEPYVVAADVYGAPPHVGRGGWTWYTGSAAWMYRAALESVLGLTLRDGAWLRLAPRIPDDWPGFTITYRLPGGETRYEICVENPGRRAGAVVAVAVDGMASCIEEGAALVALVRDGAIHDVRVTLGPPPASARPASSNR